jgi:rSAM/selenodomain-associated transferase 1
MTRVLGIVAKQPLPGLVKTRLGPPEFAATVAAAFLDDTLERFEAAKARRLIAFAPPSSRSWFAEHAAGRYELQPQADGNLGARLQAFIANELGRGAEKVVVIGCDSPTLPTEVVNDAFARLTDADVVLGPAADGGYYLLGCGRRIPPIFDAIDWSTSRVLEQTVARLGAAEWRLRLLPLWYDVDTPEDWNMLRGHVAALRRAGVDPGCPRTEQLLTKRS